MLRINMLILSVFIIINIFIVEISFGTNCQPPFTFPPAVAYQGVELGILQNGAGVALAGFETPMVSRIVMAIGQNQWDCYATYTEDVLAVRTVERPILADTIPSPEYNANNQLLCYTYSWVPLIEYITGQYSTDLDTHYSGTWGLRPLNELITIQQEVEACGDPNDNANFNCLNNLASNYSYCADVMGIIVGVATNFILASDGYNDRGQKTPWGDCTANCRPFSDPIGFYDPRINIFRHPNPEIDFRRRDFPGFTRRNKFKWVNLLEDNGKGFFNRQEHVVPHIGYTVDPITVSNEDWEDLLEYVFICRCWLLLYLYIYPYFIY